MTSRTREDIEKELQEVSGNGVMTEDEKAWSLMKLQDEYIEIENQEMEENFVSTKKALTSEERSKISGSDFALPGRRYPIHDRTHALAALRMVAAHGSEDEKKKVRDAVRRRFPNIDVSAKARKGGDYKRHWSQKKTGKNPPPSLSEDQKKKAKIPEGLREKIKKTSRKPRKNVNV